MIRKTPVRMGRIPSITTIVVLALGLLWAASATGADFVGSDTCAECHDGIAATFARNVHGRIAGAETDQTFGGCESCHGAGSAHVEEGDPEAIQVFRDDAGEKASEMCMGCHDTGPFLDWHTGPHADADVGCTACHQIHAETPRDNLLVAAPVELCVGCHAEQKTQFMLPSHHPLREGFMDCSSCHDPHTGAYTKVSVMETDRELCLSCHQQYTGPFVFDHSPVEEDCSLCHNPHGAVANNLLVQNEPFLCLQCHQPHFHSGLLATEGEFSTEGFPQDGDGRDDYPMDEDLYGVSTHDGFKRSMLTKCTQCHMSVHGTDLPSQSISGQGRALVR